MIHGYLLVLGIDVAFTIKISKACVQHRNSDSFLRFIYNEHIILFQSFKKHITYYKCMEL